VKKTKIVCTIGPATDTVQSIQALLEAGLNVARLNFSHGNHSSHQKTIENVRTVMDITDRDIAILLDTKGPEIRTIKLENGKEVELNSGQTFTFTTDETVVGNNEMVAVTYKGFAKDLQVGSTILVDDGLIKMTVTKIADPLVICTVINSGTLGQNKGINLPGVSVQLPALSSKDIADLKFGCEQGVDFVAASFIRKASDVKEVRQVLDENGGKKIKIISKIENQEGLDNFEAILKTSDGIMVARGDLGVEIPVEEVPFAQKMMIKRCNEVGKIVITATQMLDSMISNPRPTRAEAGDVANAILDGTDAVMLSGETAKGDYPLEAVTVMSQISEKSDKMVIPPVTLHDACATNILSVTEAVAKGTVDTAETLNVKLIVVATETGRAARYIRKYCPKMPIMAITNNEQTSRQLAISRGVYPIVIQSIPTIEHFHAIAGSKAKALGFVNSGDLIVVSCGEDIFKPGTTNNFKVHQIQ
jgi:pyruvate kinase